MKHFKFDDRILLHLALVALGTDRENFQKRMHAELQLSRAQFMLKRSTPSTKTNPKTGETLHAVELLYNTPTAAVLTTQYGRIKSIQRKPQSQRRTIKHTVRTKPTITIKSKRNGTSKGM